MSTQQDTINKIAWALIRRDIQRKSESIEAIFESETEALGAIEDKADSLGIEPVNRGRETKTWPVCWRIEAMPWRIKGSAGVA